MAKKFRMMGRGFPAAQNLVWALDVQRPKAQRDALWMRVLDSVNTDGEGRRLFNVAYDDLRRRRGIRCNVGRAFRAKQLRKERRERRAKRGF